MCSLSLTIECLLVLLQRVGETDKALELQQYENTAEAAGAVPKSEGKERAAASAGTDGASSSSSSFAGTCRVLRRAFP